MDVFKTYYNYLTIDCWYVRQYVTPNKTFGNSERFYERNYSF